MPKFEYQLVYFVKQNGQVPFREWLLSIKDQKSQDIIEIRLTRLRLGLLGSCRSLKNGIYELKVSFGPGFRVYFSYLEKRVILLLCGGTKRFQKKDIKKAYSYLTDYRRNEGETI